MTAIFIEGFDYYTATGSGSSLPLTTRWSIDNKTSTSPVTVAVGRYPNSQAMSMISNVAAVTQAWAPFSSSGTLTTLSFGFSIKLTTRPAANTTIFELFNSSSGVAGFTLQTSNTGTVTALVGTTSVGTTGASTLPIGTWVYFEAELIMTASGAKCIVYLNDAPIITNASFNAVATTACDYMRFSTATTYPYLIDDVYVNNIATRLGESRVIVISPNADTTQKNFQTSPTGLAGNYAAVNGLTVNNGSFVYGGTPGWKDIYEVDDMSFNPALIHGIQPVYVARKDDSATLSMRVSVVSGASTIAGTSNDLLLSTTAFFRYQDPIISVNPNTGVAWKANDVAAIKMGPEIL